MKSNELNRLIDSIDMSVHSIATAKGEYELIKARRDAVINIDRLFIERLKDEVGKEADLRPEATVIW